ncbi:MAG: MBL fold metallo-hydrolase [Tissierellia bacterium]|nr:MBL fold metallo-hydrolase [Tissierellia bacterium]
MKVIKMPAGVYAANCYLVYEENNREAIIIDPGGDADDIIAKVEELGLDAKYIILTHGHGDHIAGVEAIKDRFNIPVAIHKKDKDILEDSDRNFSSTMAMGAVEVVADILLEEGDRIEFGGLIGKIIHTPGHTPGGITINIENCLFTGDTLFAGSIGRTDFPGGSFEDIINSIKDKLLIYPDETLVYPGHGVSSTIKGEKDNNPFLK